MRSIHAQIIQEYGKNTVKTFRQWEKLAIKMAEFKNHRRFTLRAATSATRQQHQPKNLTNSGNNISHRAITSAQITSNGNNISHFGNNISQTKQSSLAQFLVQLYQSGNNISHKMVKTTNKQGKNTSLMVQTSPSILINNAN